MHALTLDRDDLEQHVPSGLINAATSCAYIIFKQDVCSSRDMFVATRFLGDGKNTYSSESSICRFLGISEYLVTALHPSQKDHSTSKVGYPNVAQSFEGLGSSQGFLYPM